MEGSGEGEVCWSFPDWPVSTFAVDCTNKRAVLAVQKWLAVISLEHTAEVKTIRKLGRSSKYEVKTVLWNPHAENRELLVSTSQQKLDIWDVSAERNPLIHSFKAHSRPVSDVSWSFSDANLLASCAVDSFIHVWDIRETRRSKTSFKAVAGASLVQWNRLSGNIIASAHDSDIRLWDMRKPTTAWGYVTAHMSRIHDVDWSHLDRHQLTTCSHDSSIKFWDTSSPRDPISTMKTGSQPVWRARNYPVGHGVAMVLVPAIHGSENRVFLWSRNNVSSPVSSLHGHQGPVVEVVWRKRGAEYQLATLSRDRTLRLWPMSEQLNSDLGGLAMETGGVLEELHPIEMSLMSQLEMETPSNAPPDTPAPSLPPANVSISSIASSDTSSLPPSLPDKSPSSSFQPQKVAQKLEHEFSLLNTKSIPSVTIERMDATQRSCTVCVEQGDYMVRFGVSFPAHYPNGAAPSFIFDKSTSIDLSSQQELYRSLTDTAQSHVKSNRPCLEPCLRRLTKVMENLVSHPPQPPPTLQPPLHKGEFELGFGHLDDEHIPFPCTTGARFCSNGMLVSFSGQVKPAENRQTPRSLDKVMSYRTHLWLMGKSRRSATYLSSSQPKGSSGSNLMQLAMSDQEAMMSSVVTIRNITELLPISYQLAQMYSLSGSDVALLCAKNADAAAQLNRSDLIRAWSAAALIADSALPVPSDPSAGVPWPQHPFSRQLIYSLFEHYGRLHDVQTLAMLSCIFQLHCQQYSQTHPPPSPPPPLPSPRTPPLPLRGSSSDRLSSSWQDIESSYNHINAEEEERAQEERAHWLNCRLLDTPMICQGDEYRRCYANILYHWRLLEQRTEVLKFQSTPSGDQNKIGFVNVCRACGDYVRGPACKKSKCFAFHCHICNLSVRGSSNFCLSCGHGGHASHMMQWFSSHQECPSGCGCHCLEASGWT